MPGGHADAPREGVQRLVGTIRTFDAADGLGWIDLDDGRAVRFGLSACAGFVPAAGLRVDADQIAEQRGVLRAKQVRILLEMFDLEEEVWPAPIVEHARERRWIDDEEETLSIHYRTFDRDAAPRTWPAPSAFTDRVYVAPVEAAPPAPHPFFAPWHDAICATAVGIRVLSPSPDGTAGRFGGTVATLARPWPACDVHGRMALIISIEPATMAPVVGVARRLTLHVCIACLERDEQAWAGTAGSPVSVEWSAGGTLRSLPPGPAFESLALAASPSLSFPPAWLFGPRLDIKGHFPITGVPPGLLDVQLRSEHSDSYTAARFAYDSHYTCEQGDVVIGGFSSHSFALCPTCVSPLRQLVCVCDYFSTDGLADAFHGNRRIRLLACDRTPACGGPERSLVISEL